MGAAISYLVTLEARQACSACGVPVAMPAYVWDSRYKDGQLFYCFNGHAMSWRETEADRLRKQIAEHQQFLENERKRHEWTKQDLEKQRKVNAGLKGEITKTKNRVGNGVCPCCNRSFQNLRRHMGSKHPGYKSE